MARYADVNKLIWQVQNNDKYGTITKQVFISLLQNSEMDDVAPVIHAHWYAKDQWSGFMCSHCGTPEINAHLSRSGEWIHYWKYCPNCGAIMDEEVE